MARIVKAGLIQAKWEGDVEKMIRKHEKMVDEASKKGVQILCLQELFMGPYFPAEQDPKWYDLAEPVPGPTTERMAKLASKHKMAICVPVFEQAIQGVYYNTTAVYDVDGKYLGKYRKNHIPHVGGFWEKFYFKPGNLGYPVFQTAYCKIAVYTCYDRHFPEGARILGLRGAEIVFNPSATVAGLSQYLWELEQPAHAVANQYFIGAINRVGVEEWKTGRFYGSSYFCNPRGEILAQASEDKDELVVAELDLDMIREVRNTWQFFRDRRPETYQEMVELLP
ncbi:MAG: nitrilase-related carbon-nitrogen hydrolase [Candidatus Methanofastidiosia archaeon]